MIYHAPTVNKLAVVFKPPESVRLKQSPFPIPHIPLPWRKAVMPWRLSAMAMAKYDTVKAQSTTGLAHAVENR